MADRDVAVIRAPVSSRAQLSSEKQRLASEICSIAYRFFRFPLFGGAGTFGSLSRLGCSRCAAADFSAALGDFSEPE